MLTACPGSGKTRTLTHRLAYQVLQKSDSRKIKIAITYTNRAAEEIINRLEDMNIDLSSIWAGTIHQFCMRYIIRPYAMYSKRLCKGYQIIDDYCKKKYGHEIAERLGVSHSVTKRYFNINDTYMPSLEMIPRLCLALGNDILMRWLEARLQGGESFSREEIEEEMVRAANAFEELRTLVNEDPPPSVRDMQHAVNRLILELGCIQEILSGHSLHRSRGALPLCPWWKFWKK